MSVRLDLEAHALRGNSAKLPYKGIGDNCHIRKEGILLYMEVER